MTKLLMLLVGLEVAVHTTLAAPQPSLEFLIDGKINNLLAAFEETITPDHPIEIRVNQPYVAEIYIQMSDVTITGVSDFVSSGSSVHFLTQDDADIYISIKSPKVTLNSGHYFINGTMVDHIELFGEGPGMISVDDMAVMLKGHGSVKMFPFSVVFTEASVNLEMWRWTINLEDLMPGTDLGTVFNEFFTMCGPEIFDTIENNLNSSGKVLTFLNNIFAPSKGSEA